MNTEKFADFLRSRRKDLGLTQEQLAEKLYISTAAVSKWERGKSLPDIAKIEDLAAALEVCVLEVLRGELSEQPLDNEPLKEVYTHMLRTTNRQWKNKCGMALVEILLLLPYAFAWLVYRSPGHIDINGGDALVLALPVVAASIVFLLLGWNYGSVICCHVVLSVIPVVLFFGWGRNGFSADYTFYEHLQNKIPMATPAFWAALALPLVIGAVQVLCWERAKNTRE